jgi:hypothetical protein
MFWDLSDLDGNGAALVGTPFVGDNVMITPVGDGTGVGTCVTLGCPAGQICLDAYQHPDDSDTRVSILLLLSQWGIEIIIRLSGVRQLFRLSGLISACRKTV